MGFQDGAGFRIAGNVVRRFVPQSRRCAFLTLDVNRSPKPVKIEMRTFKADLIEEIDALTSGQNVEVTGQIDIECVKTKKGEEVKIDGYSKFVPALTIRELKIDGSSVRAAAKREDAAQAKTTWGDEPKDAPPAERTLDDNGRQGSFGEHDKSKWPTDDGDVPF
jgi:hypothetical protein